jgi:hypothetical protein
MSEPKQAVKSKTFVTETSVNFNFPFEKADLFETAEREKIDRVIKSMGTSKVASPTTHTRRVQTMPIYPDEGIQRLSSKRSRRGLSSDLGRLE